jgi:biotin-dependent carboxylase-like uncharacterized protein
MTAALRATAPGHHVTVQDAGRRGWRRFGVSGCGAMDFPSLAAANALVGNPPDAAALEFAHVGGAWEVLADSVRIAVTGGDFAVSAGGTPLQAWRSHTLRRGERLQIKGAPDAVWGYLAVAGGFAIPPQLGSRATHLRSRIGGITGDRITRGDELPLNAPVAPETPERRITPTERATSPLRVVLGPQSDCFAMDVIAAFLAAPYRVTHRSDRMGTWLDGPSLSHADGHDVVSDGMVPGCVQVPGAGKPIVLMMDCQTIGGYPKLATIISADLPRFAQMRAGSQVRFAAIEIEAAQRIYRSYRAALAGIEQAAHAMPERSSLPFWLRA